MKDYTEVRQYSWKKSSFLKTLSSSSSCKLLPWNFFCDRFTGQVYIIYFSGYKFRKPNEKAYFSENWENYSTDTDSLKN